MDTKKGANAGAFKYRVEVETRAHFYVDDGD